MERYEPKPLQDRDSQHVGLSNAARWFGKLAAVGAAGGAVGWGIGHALKGRYPTIDPKMTAMLGAKIAAIGKLFLMWRKGEEARLGIQDMYADLKQVSELHQTDEDLRRDSALVRKEIAFERQQQAALGATGQEEIPGTTIREPQQTGERVQETATPRQASSATR